VRPKRAPESFLPYEALLETLLHELTHMVHGPHNQAFYRYLDELKQEMESLMVRGLIGEEGAKFAEAGAVQRAAWRRNESSSRVDSGRKSGQRGSGSPGTATKGAGGGGEATPRQ